MGFWKRLKEKLFGTEEEILERKKAKLEAKNQKKLLKQREKVQKLNTYVAGLSKANTAFTDYIKQTQ